MTELPGLEHDPAEWAALRERHAAQEKALARLLGLLSGIASDFGKLHSDVTVLHRGVRELGRL